MAVAIHSAAQVSLGTGRLHAHDIQQIGRVMWQVMEAATGDVERRALTFIERVI